MSTKTKKKQVSRLKIMQTTCRDIYKINKKKKKLRWKQQAIKGKKYLLKSRTNYSGCTYEGKKKKGIECKLLTGSIGSKVKTAQTVPLRNTFITHTHQKMNKC
jgi:hypothetical protein